MTRARDLADGADKDIAGTLTLDDIVLSNDMSVADDGKAIFGAGSDLQIYHNGTDSFIDETNASGWLYIRGNNTVIGKYTGETYFKGITDGAVELYHDNSKKFETTSTGVDVTGSVTVAHTGTNASPHIKLAEAGDTREFNIFNDGSGNGRLVLADSTDDTPDTEIVLADNGQVQFKTGNTQRMTVDSSGQVMIGTTTEGAVGADQLTVSSSGNTGITIRAGTSSSSAVYMSDASSGTGEYEGYIAYSHNSNAMSFATSASDTQTHPTCLLYTSDAADE